MNRNSIILWSTLVVAALTASTQSARPQVLQMAELNTRQIAEFPDHREHGHQLLPVWRLASHFRSPVNFYVVPETDRKFHTVSVERSDHQWNAFISNADMRHLIDGLKALDLRWVDYKGREAFIDGLQRIQRHRATTMRALPDL